MFSSDAMNLVGSFSSITLEKFSSLGSFHGIALISLNILITTVPMFIAVDALSSVGRL